MHVHHTYPQSYSVLKWQDATELQMLRFSPFQKIF